MNSKSDAISDARPPEANQVPVPRTLWGDTVVDPYAWLRTGDQDEIMAHLEAENAYTETVLGPLKELTDTLYEEMKARMKETDLSVPVVKDGWAYYTRTTEGLSYPRHVRCPASVLEGDMGAEPSGEGEQVMLDENVEAVGGDFFDIGVYEVSPDHRFLLWGADRQGDERFRLLVRDLETGDDIDDGLDGVSYGSAWALDNETFFYLRPDEAERPFQVWRHRVGTPPEADVLVYQEDDDRFFVGVGRDKDDSHIYIGAGSKVTDEVRVIPADDPTAEPRVLLERRHGVEYSTIHHDGRFVILTNDGAENFRVVTAPADDPTPQRWEELVATSEDVFISDIEATRHYLALYERTAGSTRIRLRSWADGSIQEIPQPEAVSTAWPGANIDYESTTLRYGYASLVTPGSVMSFDTATGERTVLKVQEVGGGYDPELYHSERTWAVSHDGVRVPVSLVARRDRAEEPGPCLLYAYGAYEVSCDPTFSSARLSLLDRGFAFAIVHARGGGEMGRHWYLDGKFANKPNTFHDVEAAARHLIDTGVTSADKLALRGGSAGGLMVGAVINQAPELFALAHADVPFVDALNTIIDPSLPLTVTEWEEWGNPLRDEDIYRTMVAYSPYENVVDADYPAVLAVAGLNDTRVGYWEAAKWVQRLRDHHTGVAPVLLWTDLGSGHGGPSGRYGKLAEEARNMAYMLDAVG